MKTKQTILKAFASVALAMGAFASADAQTNLGAGCGCPSVAARSTTLNTVYFSGLPGYIAVDGTGGGILTTGATLTCDKLYILDVKVYIPEGQTLNIAPGTLIKGTPVTNPALASALVISRGGKINAAGTESCPIVFTALADPMDGTYPVYNTGMWGGVVLLGKASNNLTLANNGPFVPGGAGKLAVANGVGTVEGFASSYVLDQYGVTNSNPPGVVPSTAPTPSSAYSFDAGLAGTQGSGNGASGNSKIKLSSSSLAGFCFQGMVVTGTGVPVANPNATPAVPATTVVSVSSDVVTLSAALTANASGTYTFTGTYPAIPAAGTAQSYYFATSIPFANSTTGSFGPEIALGTAPNISLIATNGNAVTGPIRINFAAPFGSVGTFGTANDDDNSGVMKYVSIRHSGAILSVGAEINGLTLASVGRGTTIEHIEIVSCADDNIEIFGGAVNMKYITMLYGNDDMFDYDLGWKGKAQFVFGMKNTAAGATVGSLGSPDNDNGIEGDSDDNTSNVSSKSTPVMFNFTMVGNAKANTTSDNRSLSAVNLKEGSQGELYNSVFANFRNGVTLISTQSGRTAGQNPYDYWNNNSLKIKCNSFVGMGTQGSALSLTSNFLVLDASTGSPVNGAIPSTSDTTKFLTTDFNKAYFDRPATASITEASAIPGFSYVYTANAATNVVTVKNDLTPNPALTLAGCPTPPIDGFFEPANYRGAFSSIPGDNWLSNWSYSHVLGTTQGVALCPTDIDKDGDTDVSDFLTLISAFGTSCE